MQTVRITGRGFAVGAGAIVRLSKEQAEIRAHRLEAVKGRKGVFTTRDVQEFKLGEQLGLEMDDVAKAMRHLIEVVKEKDDQA